MVERDRASVIEIKVPDVPLTAVAMDYLGTTIVIPIATWPQYVEKEADSSTADPLEKTAPLIKTFKTNRQKHKLKSEECIFNFFWIFERLFKEVYVRRITHSGLMLLSVDLIYTK